MNISESEKSSPVAIFDDPQDGPSVVGLYMTEVGDHENLSAQNQAELYASLDAICPERLRLNYDQAPEACRPVIAQIASYFYKLVVSVAKKYQGNGVPLMDLVQEGNIGLLTGVWGFEPERGHKLSTYATYWIYQAVLRAVANQSRTIRTPVHMVDRWKLVNKAARGLEKATGRAPDLAEIAAVTELEVRQVADAFNLVDGTRTTSLDESHFEEDGEGTDYYHFLADDTPGPEEVTTSGELGQVLEKLLRGLPARDEQIIRMRYGLGYERMTLEEVGRRFGLTRERIRQLEHKALCKLRHPVRARKLRAFIE